MISGHFSGWNFGIGAGGWGGLFIAAIIIAVMYLGLIFSLAEMSPALPHTGGAYSFARSAMGPWGGFITGLAESIEYIMTPAVIVFFIGSYVTGILEAVGFETAKNFQPLWWIGCYVLFVSLNYWGVSLSFKVSVVVTLLALAVLVVFWISAIPYADFSRWALNIAVGPDGALVELPDGNGDFLPKGWVGVLAALPFAVWLFLAIEELPLAAEESVDPKKDMPKGLIFGLFTLMFSALMIMFLNASIGGLEEGRMHGAFSLGPRVGRDALEQRMLQLLERHADEARVRDGAQAAFMIARGVSAIVRRALEERPEKLSEPSFRQELIDLLDCYLTAERPAP